MEPPLKRPRLSLFANVDPDPQLDQARRQNDLLLKSRFEAIFEKYAHDFDGIGDVVDLNTGKIEQDNGHLRAIGSEKDTGQSRSRSPKPRRQQSANGRSLLRAMTVAPGRDDSYFDDDNADDVIQSIETIAHNAAMSDEEDAQSADESEDDIFDATFTPRSGHQNIENGTPSTSDVDSLFQVGNKHSTSRLSSPDSLFEQQTPSSATQQNTSYAPMLENQLGGQSEKAGTKDEFNDEAIYAKFGWKVGKEVVQLLEKRDMAELHIDPAWRIPVDAQPRPTSSASSGDTVPEESLLKKTALQHSSSPNKGMSIWLEGTRRNGSCFAARAKAAFPLREESLDPLQEGFHTDDEIEDNTELERCNQVAKAGVCPYCQEQYVDRVGVMQHMNREVKFIQRGEERGDHDPEHIVKLMDYIHEQAKRKSYGRKNGPRLAMCDYKTLVELHEGAGLSFQQIIDSETLVTLKSDPELLAYLYFKWRDIEDVSGLDGQPSKEWSKTENKLVKNLIRNQKTSMDVFRRKLSKRSTVEIGNKLADKWLTELPTGKLPDEEGEEAEEETSPLPSPPPRQANSDGRKTKLLSPALDKDESEDEYRPARPQRKRRRRRRSRSSDLDHFSRDGDLMATETPSQSFDQTFAAATGLLPMSESISGLPPMPQSVIRNPDRFERVAWPIDEELSGQPPEDDELFVPSIWS